MSMLPIPKGALLYVSTGEYSDYSVTGVFRAKEEIDAENLREKWLEEHPDQRADYTFDEHWFLASVAHMIEPVDSWEWHLCDYSRASEMHTAHHDAPDLSR